MGKRAGKPVSEMEDLTSRSPGPPAGRGLRFSAGSRSQEAVPKPHPAAALLLLMFLLCHFSRDKSPLQDATRVGPVCGQRFGE